jgi:DNA-binding GntR family transcriptional regulator
MSCSWTSEMRLRSHSTLEGRRSSIDGHRHILDALASRDATGAGIAMRNHLADVAILIRDRH